MFVNSFMHKFYSGAHIVLSAPPQGTGVAVMNVTSFMRHFHYKVLHSLLKLKEQECR